MRKSVPEMSGGVKPSTRSRTTRSGGVALQHAQVAQAAAAHPGGAERALDVGDADVVHPRRLARARLVLVGVPVVHRARPHLRGALGAPAAPRRVEHDAGLSAREQRAPGGRGRGTAGRLGGRPHDLAVRGVAQIEALAAMAVQIGQRERARGDRQRLLRGITRARLPFARQHLRDVVVHRQRLDARAAIGQRPAQADRRSVARQLPGPAVAQPVAAAPAAGRRAGAGAQRSGGGRRARDQIGGHRRGVHARATRRHDHHAVRRACRPASAPRPVPRTPPPGIGAVPVFAQAEMPRAPKRRRGAVGRPRRESPASSTCRVDSLIGTFGSGPTPVSRASTSIIARGVTRGPSRPTSDGPSVADGDSGGRPAASRVRFTWSRVSRRASDVKKSLHECASASAARQRALQIGMRAHEADAVHRHLAAAHHFGVRADDAGLERGDQGHRLDDRAGQDRGVEDVGAALAPFARVGEVADEEGDAGGKRGGPGSGRDGLRRASRLSRRRGCASGRRASHRGAHDHSSRQQGGRHGPHQRRVLQLGRHRHGIVLSPSVL